MSRGRLDLAHNQLAGCLPDSLKEWLNNDLPWYDLPICADYSAEEVLQREALEARYSATNGANLSNSANWLSDAPVGEWYGVITG